MAEKEQKEALFNYQKETLQSNKRKRKRVKRILFVFVFAYILVALWVQFVAKGLYFPFHAPINTRYYNIRLNDNQLSVA